MSSIIPSQLTPIVSEELTPREGEAYFDMHSRLSAGRLYHYTTQTGLLGILKDKAVRATDIRYLNDSTEFNHARSVAIDVIDKVLGDKESDKRKLIEVLANAHSSRFGAVPTAFIFSLTELPDDLSQWRAYCASGGFALGFETRRLLTTATRFGYRLAPCIYDEQEQRRLIGELLEGVLGILGQKEQQAKELLSNGFVAIAPLFKHPAFRAEQEWRMVSTPELYADPSSIGMEVREGRSVPIPFISIPITLDHLDASALEGYLDWGPILWPIPEIIVSPTPHPDLGAISASVALLRECPIHDIISVRNSDIPYRNWV